VLIVCLFEIVGFVKYTLGILGNSSLRLSAFVDRDQDVSCNTYLSDGYLTKMCVCIGYNGCGLFG
jgi:hypothetical protein